MKITIDTKEDSAADIRKVVALLAKFIEEPTHNTNIFEDTPTPTETTNAFANMFRLTPNTETESTTKPEEEKEEPTPRTIIEY